MQNILCNIRPSVHPYVPAVCPELTRPGYYPDDIHMGRHPTTQWHYLQDSHSFLDLIVSKERNIIPFYYNTALRTGPYIIIAIWHCHKTFSQWQRSFW